MKRQLAIVAYAGSRLERHFKRTCATILSLAVVVAVFEAAHFINDSLRHEVRASLAFTPDITVQRMIAGRPSLISAEIVNTISSIPGVRSVHPRIWGYVFAPALTSNITMIGVPSSVHADKIIQGRMLQRSGEIVLGGGLANALGLQIGDEFPLNSDEGSKTFLVVGMFKSESAIRTADVLLASTEDARHLLHVPANQSTDLAVHLTTPDESSVVTRKITDMLSETRTIEKRALQRNYEIGLDTRSGIFFVLLFPSLIAFLLLSWERLAPLHPQELYEVAVLKTVGWDTSSIVWVRLWESVVIAICGTIFGFLIAYFYVFKFRAPGVFESLLGWTELYPRFELVPQVNFAQLLLVVLTVLVPFMILGLVPAWRAAMLDPDVSLRG